MPSTEIYATPRQVDSADDCFFYHFMDLPSLGTVGTTWDLRNCVDAYIGKQDFSGKRVLDVGTASGYLTFEMEKRGGEVVSFDMPSVDSWDFVPHFSLADHWQEMVESRAHCHRQMQNAYWFAHRQLQSRARVHYGNVYNLPPELGNFDVVFLGMILPHLRDPFQALCAASRLASDVMIVTNPGRKRNWISRLLGKPRFEAKFLPSAANQTCDVWWALSHSCIERMLETLGFRVVNAIESAAACHLDGKIRTRKNLSLIARRVAGKPLGISSPAQPAAA